MKNWCIVLFLAGTFHLSAETEGTAGILFRGIQSKDGLSQQIAEKFSQSLKGKLEEKAVKSGRTLVPADKTPSEDPICDTDPCLKKILETAGNNAMILGFMNREKDRVRLKMKTVRLQNGLFRTESEFNELFTDLELLHSHYAAEAAEKLLNPMHKIRRINLAEPEYLKGIKNTGMRSETAGMKVPNYGSESDDRIAKLVSVLQPDLEKADALYNEEKYDAAIDAYTEILLKIAGRLPDDRLPQMKNYADSVSRKLEASYSILLKQHIEYLDIRMNECRPQKNCDISELNEWVESGFKWKASAPQHMQNRLKTFIQPLNSRRDALQFYAIDILEQEGNDFYNNKNYENAILRFSQADSALSSVSDRNLRKKYSERFLHKIKMANEYGRLDLRTKVRGIVNEAEELNLLKKEEEARLKMKNAADLLAASKFQSKEAFGIYNKIASIMNLPLLQNADNEKKTSENRKKKRKGRK